LQVCGAVFPAAKIGQGNVFVAVVKVTIVSPDKLADGEAD
jgi:hypothetical protein